MLIAKLKSAARMSASILAVAILAIQPVFAQTPPESQNQNKSDLPSSYLDFSETNIETYEPRDSLSLCSSTGGGGSVDGFNADPEAVKFFEEKIKPKMARLIPLYQRAAAEEKLADWQLLAGLHHMETNSGTRNPTTNQGFRGVFQLSANTLRSSGIDPTAPPFVAGAELTDDQIVTQGRAAIKIFIAGKAKARTVAVDISKPLAVNDAMKLSIAYKSGEGSSWLTGRADPNLHAYSWSGFDTTPQHKMPMPWGPGSPYGDEVPGSKTTRPGSLTIWGILKQGNIGSLTGADCAGAGGSLQAITGSREELINRIINQKGKGIVFGNYGPAATQENDVRTKATQNLLVAIVAMVEQSGVQIKVNAVSSQHNDNGLHPQGRAIDIGYYGNGAKCESKAGSPPCNSSEGNQLYTFLYNNWKQLKLVELIWQDPKPGQKCIGQNGPVDCYAYYKPGTMDQHYHHIHVGVAQ